MKQAPDLSPADYLIKILNARVYDVATESALETAKNLSQRIHNTVLLKREDQQQVRSFKLRGAYNKMAHLSAEQLKKGVICASAGNHAQGVALSASRLQARAVIVMPVTTPQVKVDAVRGFGGEVVLHGDSYTDAYKHALALGKKQGLTYVHAFDDPDVIAGQGTIAMEILRQHQGPLDAVFVAIGGGGLVSGVANYIKAVRPEVKVIGVQMNDSDAMMQSVASGARVTLADVGLFSDGTAVKLVGEETFRIARGLVDEFITVDTDAVCAAIKDVFQLGWLREEKKRMNTRDHTLLNEAIRMNEVMKSSVAQRANKAEHEELTSIHGRQDQDAVDAEKERVWMNAARVTDPAVQAAASMSQFFTDRAVLRRYRLSKRWYRSTQAEECAASLPA
jgi:threonine dehydratase